MSARHNHHKITAKQKEYIEYIGGYFAVYENMPPPPLLAKEFQVTLKSVYSMLNALEAKHVLAQNAAGKYIPGPEFST